MISIIIITIKIIYLPIVLIPFYIFIKNKKKLALYDKRYFLILFALLIFILKNLLSTGCLVYPVVQSCFDFISWSNSKSAGELTFLGEYFNKSWTSYNGVLTKSEYVKNFNWFVTWFLRGKIEIIEVFSTVLLVFLITVYSFGFSINNNIKIKKNIIHLIRYF